MSLISLTDSSFSKSKWTYKVSSLEKLEIHARKKKRGGNYKLKEGERGKYTLKVLNAWFPTQQGTFSPQPSLLCFGIRSQFQNWFPQNLKFSARRNFSNNQSSPTGAPKLLRSRIRSEGDNDDVIYSRISIGRLREGGRLKVLKKGSDWDDSSAPLIRPL